MRSSFFVFGVLASLAACQKLPIPASKGSQTLSAPKTITGVFDGGMKKYGRGKKCQGQKEGGEKDTVFLLAPGATLKNAIIGADQSEGVYCKGPCHIENVWWEKVCEDALSIKGDGAATIIGGGAFGAKDKVIQHNGFGTVTVKNFIVIDFGKLYRSCGNCKGNGKARKIVMSGIQAYKGKNLAGINTNFGDKATISGCATGVKTICQGFQGTTPGNEPKSGSACAPQTLPACPATPKANGGAARRSVRFRFRSRSADLKDLIQKWLPADWQ